MAVLGRNCFGCITSIRVGRVAQMHEYLIHHCSAHKPESFVLQHFEHGNALKIHNKILYEIYPGLHEETGPAYFSSVALQGLFFSVAFMRSLHSRDIH